jgi:hypothetical protein
MQNEITNSVFICAQSHLAPGSLTHVVSIRHRCITQEIKLQVRSHVWDAKLGVGNDSGVGFSVGLE